MSAQKINAILFDLDGTLVDSLRDIAGAMNRVLRNRGYPTHPESDYRNFVGDGMTVLAERVLPPPDNANPDRIRACVADMRKQYARCWRDHAVPYPGIPELLDALVEQNIHVGILSNKPEPFTVEMVATVFPEIPFRTVRGAREGVPVKPDPAAALEILEEWRLPAEQVLYAGDTNTDMRTGKRAGMWTFGVTWGFRNREELEDSGADRIVDHPSGILHALTETAGVPHD